ncbi:MAG: hypothetical protein MUO70_03935, partial [Euryarchaeota archaeon]|nr:hypothetical protein [Euryarchaeota archaeon]
MARGYPDYFGTSIWPKYGTPIRTGGLVVNVPAGLDVDVIDISANGVFFCAEIRFSTIGDYLASYVRLEIDNQLAWFWLLSNLTLPTSLGGAQELMAITYLDRLSDDLRMTLSREIPFRDRVKISVDNGSA